MKIGLEVLIEKKLSLIRGKKIGMVVNQASVDKKLNSAIDLLLSCPGVKISAIFSPQHGLMGEKQANMIESDDFFDSKIGVQVFSLYGKRRKPEKKMLDNIEIMIFDLQDVGTRVYTYISTLAYVMEACKKAGKELIVLDRPNPINGKDVEGNILEEDFKSFVGLYPLAMRHGMTLGEIALMFNEEFKIKCNLKVIPMLGWKRSMWFDETEYTWINPSPNIPTLDSATVYPATVYLEGTNISEARGTTKPFEFCGAPFIEAKEFSRELNNKNLPGVFFRPVAFEPVFDKWKGRKCYGVQLHVINRNEFKPIRTGLVLLKTLYDMYPEEFEWRKPPYEYEYEKLPIDVIWGTDKIRKALEQGREIPEIENFWHRDLDNFKKQRMRYLLYE